MKRTSLKFVWFNQCLSVKSSEANRDGADAEFPFQLFSLFLPHLTLAHEKRSENCLRFATSGPSLFVSIIAATYNIFPRADRGQRAKKKFWRSHLLTPSASTIEILSTLTKTEFDCEALLAML